MPTWIFLLLMDLEFLLPSLNKEEQIMKVLIIDDDKLITHALKTIIEMEEDMEVVDLGFSAEDAINLYDVHRPDILLLDIRMKEKSGIDAFKDIIKKHPEANIVFLTTFMDDEYIKDSIIHGAKGYLLKSEFENIVPAIRSVYAGQSVFESKVASKIPDILNTSPKYDPDLSEKELELLKYISEGLNNKEIANAMYLSEGTVRNYISVILEKLNLRDRTQLAVYYLKGQ